ncbi:hypothetical protein CTAYLR_008813 [Chrysophaeum taylorii]|uniref:GST C-terminal domain-containing protein n=1 Tax=Chrysophaeum taylorii TaxID=2483200 RepID=A0AAD7XJS4_9STRA|nr:hypothetical protein CTAYLR_008813 [Chrysophaeum taylorii]
MMAELAPQTAEGAYARPAPQVGGGGEPPELVGSKRYELYVGNACPWCHRTLLALALRNVSQVHVTTLVDDATRASRGGWVVAKPPDPVFGARDLKQIYDRATGAPYRGRCTAPLLVDATSGDVVARDSADIVAAVAAPGLGNSVDLRPADLIPAIDEACAWIYADINDGVYKCGFATRQAAYDGAEKALHDALERADARLEDGRFLLGERLTQADVWLYPTISRFDAVYATLFKCGRKTVRANYPNLQRWLEDLSSLPGVQDTFDLRDAAASYFSSLFPLNPSGIVPNVPDLLPTPPRTPLLLDDVTSHFKSTT